MNKKKLIEALKMASSAFALMAEAVAEDTMSAPVKGEVPVSPVEETVENVEAEQVADNTTEANEVEESFDEEALNKMKYNEFKKYASSLGVDCKGTRAEIMDRVRAHFSGNSAVEESVPVAEEVSETPAKSDSDKSGKKLGKAKADEPTTDEFDEQAEEIAKSTDVEDIIEALADVNIKANKKNAVTKLAQALREGLIELDDDENESPVEAEVGDSNDEEIAPDTYTAKYDPAGYNDPANMSEERQESIIEKMTDILEGINNGSITEDDITSYLEDNLTDDESEILGDEYEDEDLIRFYMELVKRTIDNDGEEHEPSDPYEVGETDMCCGHELKYSKKTKKYICEVCGTEYEAE